MFLCLVKVEKKTLQKPCTNNLAHRRIQKDRDQSKYIKLKTLRSRRLLQGLIKQRERELSCDISTGQHQSSCQTFPLIMFIASLLYFFHVSVVYFYVLLKLE